jgi:hypothetical protein
MMEQIDWLSVGSVVLGIFLWVDSALIMLSVTYYCALYERPMLRRKTDQQIREKEKGRDAQRYAVTLREIGLGSFLVVLGLAPEIGEVQGAAFVIGASFALYGGVCLLIWLRNRKSR